MNQTVRKIIGPTILLRGGTYLDFEAPWDSYFDIEDIAHGLAMTCRFAGQCNRFYSVAQHSVHVSQIVPAKDAYAGLMHDAPEAFIHDISKPLKTIMPEYKLIERRLEKTIADRFQVPYPLPASVKQADLIMLATEQRQLMNNRDLWTAATPLDCVLPVMGPDEAKKFFLDRFKELRRG